MGAFVISPIVRNRDGCVTGYGAVCGMHANAGEPRGRIYCKKAGALGAGEAASSAEELVLRLKRWLLAGILQQHEWPLHGLRTAHVRLALRDLASGPSEQELDAWMASFMARAAADQEATG